MSFVLSRVVQLKMWQEYEYLQAQENEKSKKEKRKPKNVMPSWLDQYIEYKFNLFDRTGESPSRRTFV